MARRLLVLVLLACATVLVRPAYACSCHALPTDAEVLASADLVFAGELLADVGGGYARVRVDRVYRGEAKAIVVMHRDPMSGTSCAMGPWDPGPGCGPVTPGWRPGRAGGTSSVRPRWRGCRGDRRRGA